MKEKKRKKVRGRLKPLFISALQSMTQQRDHTLEDSPDHRLLFSIAYLALSVPFCFQKLYSMCIYELSLPIKRTPCSQKLPGLQCWNIGPQRSVLSFSNIRPQLYGRQLVDLKVAPAPVFIILFLSVPWLRYHWLKQTKAITFYFLWH